jgi:Mrp family chromosome partitioning ATPase
LARLADATVLVVRHGVTTEAQVRAALDRLASVHVAGVVLNQATSKIPRPLRRRLANW